MALMFLEKYFFGDNLTNPNFNGVFCEIIRNFSLFFLKKPNDKRQFQKAKNIADFDI